MVPLTFFSLTLLLHTPHASRPVLSCFPRKFFLPQFSFWIVSIVCRSCSRRTLRSGRMLQPSSGSLFVRVCFHLPPYRRYHSCSWLLLDSFPGVIALLRLNFSARPIQLLLEFYFYHLLGLCALFRLSFGDFVAESMKFFIDPDVFWKGWCLFSDPGIPPPGKYLKVVDRMRNVFPTVLAFCKRFFFLHCPSTKNE